MLDELAGQAGRLGAPRAESTWSGGGKMTGPGRTGKISNSFPGIGKDRIQET